MKIFGTTVAVAKCLGCSQSHVSEGLISKKDKNVAFISLTEKFDTSTPFGIAVFSILAAIRNIGV